MAKGIKPKHKTPYITKFYTVGRTVVCVFINRNKRKPKVLARGISICSPIEKFDYCDGKQRAFDRAEDAYKTRCIHGEPIMPRAFHVIRGDKIVGYGSHLKKVIALGFREKWNYEPLRVTPQEEAILQRIKTKR